MYNTPKKVKEEEEC